MDIVDLDIGTLDSWIEQLFECKQLSEMKGKRNCASVRTVTVKAEVAWQPLTYVCAHVHKTGAYILGFLRSHQVAAELS
ncbi:hypothetical protein GGH14_005428 [Coemansia sp. RSA 370]|nr:hypothetical protein GGH14_005428 [Coemansia sp. RSA 370]